MTATVEHFKGKVLFGRPTLLVVDRAKLECGCCIYVGKRIDNWEAATVAYPCAEAHVTLVKTANAALQDSLRNPTDAPLVDVCARLLTEAAAGSTD